ncbi:MAG TPA: caspase family protein, partial [Pyrinomonadaceae bacterium]|nr:caspase family protein [Pyrinomonadaceae bacterium]
GMLLVSFAGHGMERSGQAFLLPADAQISDQISFLEETAISMSRVKSWIKEMGVGQVLLLLDACRNDPGGRADAPNNLSDAYVNAFSFDRRNREVQAFATMYATGIGQRAYEYTEKKQGYFSWAVVEGLKGAAANDKGEVTLSQLVKYVQDAVPRRIAVDLGSTKQQKPFAVIEGYRADELVLAVTNAASKTASNVPGQIATVDPAAIELAYWDTIKSSTNPNDFKAYLDKYPDGQFAELAKSRANAAKPSNAGGDSVEMVFWNAIKDSHNASDFRAYLTKFPNGLFVELANSRISSLESEANERERAKANAAAEDIRRNTHIFEVRDATNTEGALTVAPGTVSFAPKKSNAKRDVLIPCADIKRVEAGQSAMAPPHVNIFVLTGGGGGKLRSTAGAERQMIFYTQSGGAGLFAKTPIVNVTSEVITAITDACRMVRTNK